MVGCARFAAPPTRSTAPLGCCGQLRALLASSDEATGALKIYDVKSGFHRLAQYEARYNRRGVWWDLVGSSGAAQCVPRYNSHGIWWDLVGSGEIW